MTIQDAFSVNFDQNFSYLDAAATALTSLSTVASTAAGAISAVGSAVQAASGYTLNSIKTVTLKSPDFRQFTLNWKFAPKTPQESLNIQMLLYSLRKGMTPQAELAGLAFEFPRIYTMFFSPNPQWLFKFKPCVLKNLSVNYQGNNPIPSFFTSEAPESIAVQMTWLELEYWKRSDYKGEDFPTQDPLDNFNWYEYRPPLTEQELAALWEEARDAEQGAFVVGGPR